MFINNVNFDKLAASSVSVRASASVVGPSPRPVVYAVRGFHCENLNFLSYKSKPLYQPSFPLVSSTFINKFSTTTDITNVLTIGASKGYINKRGYADYTYFSKDNLASLKFALRPTKKGTLIFSFTDVFNEDFFIERVGEYIDVGHIYYVISKIHYGLGVVGRNRGEKVKFSDVFTPNQISLDYSDGDITQITEFYNEIISQLNHTLEKYNIAIKEIVYVELIFKIVDKKVLSDITYNPKSTVDEITKKIL